MFFFFFNDTATTEIYTLSLHDALPISLFVVPLILAFSPVAVWALRVGGLRLLWSLSAFALVSVVLLALFLSAVYSVDRKSTRLNSSHANISYAVFCLKKKKNSITPH